MARLGQELYNESFNDIREAQRIQLFFSDSYKSTKHTELGQIYLDLSLETQKWIARMLRQHRNDWGDDIPLPIIRASLIEGRISRLRAMEMIYVIAQLGYEPRPKESEFMDSVVSAPEDSKLGIQASKLMKDIFDRALHQKYQTQSIALLK